LASLTQHQRSSIASQGICSAHTLIVNMVAGAGFEPATSRL
jgi:hypothetical protein